MLEINLLDVGVVVFLLALLGRGLFRGFTREAASLVGIVGGFALARRFQPDLQPYLESLFADPNVAAVMAYALIFTATMLLVMVLGAAIRKVMNMTVLSWVDHVLGGLAGLAKGLLIASLAFFLVQGFFPGIPLVETAQTKPFFDSMIDYLRVFLPAAFTYKFPSFTL